MAKLYDLRAEYQRVLDSLPEDGSLTDEQAGQLRAIGESVEDKLDQYRRWYKNLGSDKDALDHEIAELQRKRDSVNKTREWVRLEIIESLRQMGCDRLDFAVGGVRLQENSVATLVVDDEMISPTWFKQTQVLDRESLREWLESGRETAGATLVKHKHLRVT